MTEYKHYYTEDDNISKKLNLHSFWKSFSKSKVLVKMNMIGCVPSLTEKLFMKAIKSHSFFSIDYVKLNLSMRHSYLYSYSLSHGTECTNFMATHQPMLMEGRCVYKQFSEIPFFITHEELIELYVNYLETKNDST